MIDKIFFKDNDFSAREIFEIADDAYNRGAKDTLEDVNEMLKDYGMEIDLKTRTCKVSVEGLDGETYDSGPNIPSDENDAENGDFKALLGDLKDEVQILELKIKRLERAVWGN